MPAEMLVGRRLADSALRSAAGGAGGVVLLVGEAGLGKTALAAEAVAYAKAHGAAAGWGTCWEGDGAPGFWPWIQVIRTLAADDAAGARGRRGHRHDDLRRHRVDPALLDPARRPRAGRR